MNSTNGNGQISLMQGDCLELMKSIPDASIDMILCDLPYETLNRGNVNASWDKKIPLDILWKEYSLIISH